ncbi:MAG: leucyl aminopeptidase [Romboutsia sp.]
MDIKNCNSKLENLNKNIIVITLFENEKIETDFEELNLISKDFEGKYNKIETINTFINNDMIKVCLVGLGNKEHLNNEKIRILGGNLSKKLKLMIKKDSINVDILENNLCEDGIYALVEGIILGDYDFKKYKTDYKAKAIDNIVIYTKENVSKGIEKAKILAKATIIARDLVNEPANVIYPETLANEVINLGKEYGFEVEVYEQEKIEELKMDAFLAVAKGSEKKPRFIVMRYIPNKESKEILGLVGKGLTFDTGGYSIKPTGSMVNMKTDMGGAASVIGAMCAIVEDKLDKNVVAVVAACENAIAGNAYKPGDIINSMGKKTIEILNTDAEGRLTLADAVYYIVNNEKVTSVLDIATLTGAAMVALGTVTSAVITNNDEFYNELEKAVSLSGEKIWKMPVFDEYKDLIKGSEADLKNSPGRDGGCITAGLFVGEFVGDTPWLHVDIAGTSESNKSVGYKSKGATGEGVRTLYYLARDKKQYV